MRDHDDQTSEGLNQIIMKESNNDLNQEKNDTKT